MLNLKYDTSEDLYETETDSQIQRSDLQLPREKQVRIGSKHKLLYIEWINNRDTILYPYYIHTIEWINNRDNRELYSISCDRPYWKRI